MATNPYFTQYHTQRFSFIGSPQQRDWTYTKDQRFLNMYPELIKSPISDGKKYYLKKRPGTQLYRTSGSTNGQGLYYWNGSYFYVLDGALYKDGAFRQTLSSNTNIIGFCEYRDDTRDLLFVADGLAGWILSNNGDTVTKVTDSNFPSPHIPAPVFLDGYIFLAKAGTQTFYNSKLEDPFTWPADGFLNAEMYPDSIVMLTKAQNYLVAVGAQSIEFFYDNGNATGSPMQRNAPAVSQFGTPAPYSVNQTEKEVIMIGATGNGGRTVWVVDGFQPKEIGNEPVREALDNEGAGIQNASAFTIQCAGHKWYVMNLTTSGRTFVYDFEEQMWHEWTSGTSGGFSYRYAADSGSGSPLLMTYNGVTQAFLTPTIYQDTGTPLTCQVTTAKIDFDTIKRKRLYRLSLITDSPNGTTNSPMTVQWSDDDYNTWTTGVTLQVNASYPTITQLGYTRRRAFKFTYSDNYPLRMEAFEVDIIQEVRR